jgi:hypothetical protein
VAGGPADLVVLDADPLEVAAADGGVGDGATGDALRKMPVAGTLLAGRWTHRTF